MRQDARERQHKAEMVWEMNTIFCPNPQKNPTRVEVVWLERGKKTWRSIKSTHKHWNSDKRIVSGEGTRLSRRCPRIYGKLGSWNWTLYDTVEERNPISQMYICISHSIVNQNYLKFFLNKEITEDKISIIIVTQNVCLQLIVKVLSKMSSVTSGM